MSISNMYNFFKCYKSMWGKFKIYFIYNWVWIGYINWIFLFILLCYNICILEPVINVDLHLIFENYLIPHLPLYCQYTGFLHMDNLACMILEEGQYEYEILQASLDEIDYPVSPNNIFKTIKYIQWHQLPTWSASDEQSWNNIYDCIMQTGQGNWTHDFEKLFLKYVLGDVGFKQYMPPKYTAWRFMESLYIQNLLFQLKNLSINLERWYIVKRYVHNRLYSQRQCGYLFRCYDTFFNLYCSYEIIQHLSWSQSLNSRIKWVFQEYNSRKPLVRLIGLAIKAVVIVVFIYGWYPYLP